MNDENMMELRTIVNFIISEAQRVYYIADEYRHMGARLSKSDYSKLVSNSFSFTNCNNILSSMELLRFSDCDSDEHKVLEIESLVEEMIERMTVIKVLYSDLINLITYPHDGDEIKSGLLAGLSIQMNVLLYKRDALIEIADQELPQI